MYVPLPCGIEWYPFSVWYRMVSLLHVIETKVLSHCNNNPCCEWLRHADEDGELGMSQMEVPRYMGWDSKEAMAAVASLQLWVMMTRHATKALLCQKEHAHAREESTEHRLICCYIGWSGLALSYDWGWVGRSLHCRYAEELLLGWKNLEYIVSAFWCGGKGGTAPHCHSQQTKSFA